MAWTGFSLLGSVSLQLAVPVCWDLPNPHDNTIWRVCSSLSTKQSSINEDSSLGNCPSRWWGHVFCTSFEAYRSDGWDWQCYGWIVITSLALFIDRECRRTWWSSSQRITEVGPIFRRSSVTCGTYTLLLQWSTTLQLDNLIFPLTRLLTILYYWPIITICVNPLFSILSTTQGFKMAWIRHGTRN